MPEWIQGIDDHVLRWFLDHHTKFLDQNLLNVTALGSTTVLAMVAVFAVGVLLFGGQCRHAVLVGLVVVGVFFATDAIKDQVARRRPEIGKGVIPTPHSPSFPSGHASLTMTVLLVVAMCVQVRPRKAEMQWASGYLVVWAVVVILLVGISRLYLGVHFLSDVVGGWLLGVAFVGVFWGLERLTGGRTAPDAGSVSRAG